MNGVCVCVCVCVCVYSLCDGVRQEFAMSGYTEVLTLTLCAWAENYDHLNVPRDTNEAVEVTNPQTREFQIVRTRLLPGLLKTLASNKSHTLPLDIFEVGDVVVQDKVQCRYIYIYIYIYMCVCVCACSSVCVCESRCMRADDGMQPPDYGRGRAKHQTHVRCALWPHPQL